MVQMEDRGKDRTVVESEKADGEEETKYDQEQKRKNSEKEKMGHDDLGDIPKAASSQRIRGNVKQLSYNLMLYSVIFYIFCLFMFHITECCFCVWFCVLCCPVVLYNSR